MGVPADWPPSRFCICVLRSLDLPDHDGMNLPRPLSTTKSHVALEVFGPTEAPQGILEGGRGLGGAGSFHLEFPKRHQQFIPYLRPVSEILFCT